MEDVHGDLDPGEGTGRIGGTEHWGGQSKAGVGVPEGFLPDPQDTLSIAVMILWSFTEQVWVLLGQSPGSRQGRRVLLLCLLHDGVFEVRKSCPNSSQPDASKPEVVT